MSKNWRPILPYLYFWTFEQCVKWQIAFSYFEMFLLDQPYDSKLRFEICQIANIGVTIDLVLSLCP